MRHPSTASGPVKIAPGVWRKTYGSDQRLWREALLGFVARRLGLPALQPVPRPALAAARAAMEADRIAELAALGARVPAILGRGEDYLDLEDLGPTLSIVLTSEREQSRRVGLIEQGFRALSELHSQNGVLSEAFVRNMTVAPDGRIGFIDLETAPLDVMSAHEAQARDIVFYTYSTARFLPCGDAPFSETLAGAFSAAPDAVRAAIVAVTERLRALRLPARMAGRGGLSLLHALTALDIVAGSRPELATRPPDEQSR